MSETFKIVVIGAPNSGKSALVRSYVSGGKMAEGYKPSANMTMSR